MQSNYNKDIINSFLGIEPISINSSVLSQALRDRYYWMNIPNVTNPKEINIELQKILSNAQTNHKKARYISVMGAKSKGTPTKMLYRYLNNANIIFKGEKHYKECLDKISH